MTATGLDRIKSIKSFSSLVKYLCDELKWPLDAEDLEDLTFEYEPEELGLDPKAAVKVREIKQLRPFTIDQPWGIFYISFEPKRLPVVVLRRILRALVIKKRASANKAQRAAWNLHDLLFISAYGESDDRTITFAHFSEDSESNLPTLRVIGWDDQDTPLHLAHCVKELGKLRFDEAQDTETWREQWSSAFTLRHREVITTSRELAVRLADLARRIRKRANAVLAVESDAGPLRKLHKAFQETLIHDLSEDDFADMYAQTIAYGLFSARCSRPAGLIAENIVDMVPVTNPFLQELLSTFLTLGGRKANIDFDELGISEVVDMLREANMPAVLRDFGDRDPFEDPVIHFYELFLKEYDAKKRIQRGVFYTPRPVVSFIVRSVDELLRTEFGLEYGLADITTWAEMAERHKGLDIPEGTLPDQAFVQILDPATGTGTFLVEVIDLIHKKMTEKWKAEGHGAKKIEQLWNDYAPKHLLPRLHGYELMMAPYAIAHMKIGLKLFETGYRFDSDERARVYLTNALEPATEGEIQEDLFEAMPALAHEAEAVNAIKEDQRFTVVIGNPPYSKISVNMGEWASNLSKSGSIDGVRLQSYYEVDGKPLKEKKLWLQDDYVKFIRFSQYIIGKAGRGVMGYVSNHGFLGAPTFNGMRQSLTKTFQQLRVVNLHGDTKVGERPPAGVKDVNVFNIQQGVTVSLLTKKEDFTGTKGEVVYSDVWGDRESKYSLLASQTVADLPFEALFPQSPLYLFVPSDQSLDDEFEHWPLLPELFPVSTSGIVTARDAFVIDFDANSILERIADFRDLSILDSEIRERYFSGKGSSKYPDGDTRGWKLPAARKKVEANRNWKKRITKCYYRPFDIRPIYYCSSMVDWPRPEIMGYMSIEGNIALLATRQTTTNYSHVVCTRVMTEMKACSHDRNTEFFPLWVREKNELWEKDQRQKPQLNISYLASNLVKSWFRDKARHLSEEKLGYSFLEYVYAVLHSPTYRMRYENLLQRSYPRVPMTSERRLAIRLVSLGSELISLHLMESPKLDDHVTTVVGSGELRVEKVSYSNETVWLDKAKTYGFQGIPEEVWNFHIGGYQVCEKWLKDRQAKGGKNPRPARVLTDEDIDHYQKIVVALNETIRLMGEIDEVIDEHEGWPDAFRYKF